MSSQKKGRHVNHLLHTLRGEQFRHAQNVRQSRTHLTSLSTTRNTPTLPVDLTHASADYDSYAPQQTKREESQSTLTCSGPGPPKSWTLMATKDVCDTPGWRTEALSLLYTHLEIRIATDKMLPLSLLCLISLVAGSTITQLRNEVLPFVPQHLRRDLIRYTAVHAPLSSPKLYVLMEAEGHTDGEIIIAGPSSTIQDDYFLRDNTSSETQGVHGSGSEERMADWDSDEQIPRLLRTFILLSSRLAISTLLTLPPTITHLALINIPLPIPIHRLPGTCPLIVVLDLSYNEWLREPSNDTLKILDRVEWSRWNELHVLGIRECSIPDRVLLKLNKGRWDEVEIIQ